MALTEKQKKAVEGLLIERSVSAVALMSGVSTRSIQLWLHNEEFLTALSKARSSAMTANQTLLMGCSSVLIRRLHEIADNVHSSQATILEASKIILPLVTESHEKELLLARIDRLERQQRQGPSEPWEPSGLVLEGVQQ